MNPALSVILFTTLSGAGYGLLFLMSLGSAGDLLPLHVGFGATALGLALALIISGLLCSTFHLGHPERAWRAFSQWRSSWLSREGVAAVTTFVPALGLAAGWLLVEVDQPLFIVCALFSAAGALLTVFCTAKIYASLKTVRQWHQPLVLPLYLLFALATGALLLTALLALWGEAWQVAAGLAALSLAIVWPLKLLYWGRCDSGKAVATIESATGLGALGSVRLLEPPHSEENYLLKEMGYRVARKHAVKLRRLAINLGAAAPLLCLAVSKLLEGNWPLPFLVLAALLGLLGTLVERWLFFAEARHTVTLFYGRTA